MRDLHQLYDWQYIGQIIGGDFTKFCGLLRIYKLYFQLANREHASITKLYLHVCSWIVSELFRVFICLPSHKWAFCFSLLQWFFYSCSEKKENLRADDVVQWTTLWVVHKLRWQDFRFFWPPTLLRWLFLPYKSWHFWTKGQLNSEWIYEVIVSPKCQPKIFQISAQPNKQGS